MNSLARINLAKDIVNILWLSFKIASVVILIYQKKKIKLLNVGNFKTNL